MLFHHLTQTRQTSRDPCLNFNQPIRFVFTVSPIVDFQRETIENPIYIAKRERTIEIMVF